MDAHKCQETEGEEISEKSRGRETVRQILRQKKIDNLYIYIYIYIYIKLIFTYMSSLS